MQLFNYHTHTYRCGHAGGDDEQYVRAAIAAGYQILGFSDHAPYPGVVHRGDRMNMEELDGYITSINHLKEKYADQIEIKLGLEIEYFPEMEYYYDKLREKTDYLIVGQHNQILDAMEYNHFTDDNDVTVYADQIVMAIERGYADIIAHPDYFMLGRRNWSEACDQAAQRICEASILHDIPLELNTNGIRYGKQRYDEGLSYPYPFRPFWEIIAKTQAPVIIGVDAHKPMTLLEHERLDQAMESLKDLSINFREDFRI